MLAEPSERTENSKMNSFMENKRQRISNKLEEQRKCQNNFDQSRRCTNEINKWKSRNVDNTQKNAGIGIFLQIIRASSRK